MSETQAKKLNRLTERIWTYPFEEERDRPILGYIRGDRWSLAVDAGHSQAHTREFYRALEDAGLPLPSLTVLTHWHWDHTFGMHAAHGLCVSNARTKAHLERFRERMEKEGKEIFFSLHDSIRREYAGDKPVIITLPDLVYSGEMLLELGNCPVRLFEAPSPHTDDSTLVLACGEKALFVGDAAGGAFPTWEKDASLCAALADVVERTPADILLESHWIPQTKRELLSDLRADAGQA